MTRFNVTVVGSASIVLFLGGIGLGAVPPSGRDSSAVIQRRMNRVTAAQRQAAAARKVPVSTSRQRKFLAPLAAPALTPGGTPDYFNVPNWTNSPPLHKFVDSLPGLGQANANNLGQYIPVAVADNSTYPGSDYYRIGLVQFAEQMHSDLPATRLRGYRDLAAAGSNGNPHYLGPMIIARSGRPVRVKFTNMLDTGSAGDLFIPVDTTVMGAGMGPLGMAAMPMNYTQNRATLHLHGGLTPWISDGTPHQWTAPAGEMTPYKKGVSARDVPDMPATGTGELTFYYPNQQSGRLMFYHDHAYGITRLNVYAGEAAGYLLTDGVEDALIDSGKIPGAGAGVYRYGIPLIIQDKTFVPDNATLAATDPTWDPVKWGGFGQLWFPHVYMPNQNPADPAGVNAFGRWDYGPWFWPPVTAAAGLVHGPVQIGTDPQGNPIYAPGTPNVSMVMEAFMDTPIVNGTAYPYVNVERKAYRFRILNACNDRYLNLQLYYADPAAPTEVKMVPADPNPAFPPYWPTMDGRAGGVPDPAMAGPEMVQIGTEGGLLPASVVLPNTPIGYDLDKRSITVLNVKEHTLFLGPAERADVIIDFSQVPDNSTIILYNDSPAPVPAGDTRLDYYTGDPDQTATGGARTTLPGFGPNTRTIMQFRVSGSAATPFDVVALQEALPHAYVAAQAPPVVPQMGYPAPYAAAVDTYSHIQDTALTFTPVGASAPVTMPMEPKAIQELFEMDYGRMNSTLGVELPFTNINIQTTIPLGYIDNATEIVAHDTPQLWKITHNGIDTHAVHFHLFNVQLVNRVDWAGVVKPPDANELGWKDTVRMNPLEDCIVAIRPVAPAPPFPMPESIRPLDPTMPVGDNISLTDPATGNKVIVPNDNVSFGWEYVWHCHLLGHEEMDMMRPLILTPLAVPSDTTPPVAVGFVSPAAAGPGGQANVTITIGADDNDGGSGVASISYRISGGPLTAVSGSLASVVVPAGGGTVTYFATDNAGNSGVSASLSIPAAPGAPTAVTAVADNASVMVSFTAPASTGGSLITFYTVTASPGGLTAAGPASPILITGLTNGTTYTFTVTATNAAGTGPASSPPATATPSTVPGAPMAVTAVGGNMQATVSFTPPAATGGSPITSYTVTSIPDNITATGTAAPITVPGLVNGRAYTFTVAAGNINGSGPASAPSNVVSPSTGPGAPAAVTAVAGDAQATVTFTAPDAGGSPILFYTVTSTPDNLTAIGASSPITITGLANGTAYTFTVTATNANAMGSASGPSNSVTPSTLPGMPTAVVAVAGNAQAVVSFTPPTSIGGSPITSYTVTASPGGLTATGTAGPITVTGLANGTAYTFTVAAANANGAGPASSPSNIVVPSTLPGAPTAVTAVAGDAQAVVSFTAPDAGGSPITSYTVTSSPGNITATGAASPITVTGLVNGTTYTFTVTATNATGTGPASAPSGSVTLPVSPAPGTPFAATSVTAAAGDGQAVVSFTPPASDGGSPITSYTVTSSPDNIVATGTAGPITVTGLTNGTTYTFTVVAVNAIGTGPASDPSNAVTPSAAAAPPAALFGLCPTAGIVLSGLLLACAGLLTSPVGGHFSGRTNGRDD